MTDRLIEIGRRYGMEMWKNYVNENLKATIPSTELGIIKCRPLNFNLKLLFMIYKATCFDHEGGHHQAWRQDITEEDYCQWDVIMALQVVDPL
jgi:hypothetical protein